MYKQAITLALFCVSSSAFGAEALTDSASSSTAASASVGAQSPAPGSRDEGPRTLVGQDSFIQHSGWYLAPTLGATSVDGDPAAMIGARGAWLINRSFGIGLAVNAFSNDLGDEESADRVDGGYGGLLLQYILFPDEVVHLFADATIGGGAVCIGASPDDDRGCDRDYGFFAVETTANLELNVARHVRLAIGGGYRFASSENESPLSGGDIGGFVMRTAVNLGEF